MNDQPVHYFSIWLDSDFGKGSSKGGCTTFNSPRLSSEENFKIHSLEVWAVERVSDAVHKVFFILLFLTDKLSFLKCDHLSYLITTDK